MASPIFLRSLPRATVKPSMLGKLRDSTCIICLDEFLAGDQITLLPCSHLYHTDCIIAALKTNNTCPLCRHEFPRVETQPEEPQQTRRRRRIRELFMMLWFSHERFPSTPGRGTFPVARDEGLKMLRKFESLRL